MAENTDPFVDPSSSSDEVSQTTALPSFTIAVGTNASLVIGTESLVVYDQRMLRRSSGLCGLWPNSNHEYRMFCRPSPKPYKAIPLFNILWAEVQEWGIMIHYAVSTKNDKVRVSFLYYDVEKTDRSGVASWVEKLLERAYGKSQRRKRIKVLINPFGGKGKALKQYFHDAEPIFAAAQCKLDVEVTEYCGHAVEIAEKLNYHDYDVLACCSGDGLPHEVFNGLARKPDGVKALKSISVVQLPCGSGNALSWNLNNTGSPSVAALCIVKGIRMPLDLISISQGEQRTLSFLSQSVGIIAESDLATEHLRFLGGQRFTVGFIQRVFHKTLYPCDIWVKLDTDDKNTIRKRYHREIDNHLSEEDRRGNFDLEANLPSLKYGTVNDPLPPDWVSIPGEKIGNFYCGNMAFMSADANFFSASLPSDGRMDLITINGDLNLWPALTSLMAVGDNTLFEKWYTGYRKIEAYRIVPRNQKSGYISVDGEKISFAPFQAEVHRGLGTVLSRNGRIFEAEGVRYDP